MAAPTATPMRNASRRGSQGFTLFELLVVVVLLAVLGTLAAPNLSQFLAEQRGRRVVSELASDLSLARSEALKRNTAVRFRARSGDWAQGWEVLAWDPDLAADVVLTQRDPLPSGLSMRVNNDANTAITEAQYDPRGRVLGMSVNRKISIAHSNSAYQGRCLVITPSGTTRTKLGACP